MLYTKELQLNQKINSEHPQHPGLKLLSTKQLQLIQEINSEQP